MSEKDLAEAFIYYATKLMQLEQTYGLTYREVTEDFEKKRKEAAEAEDRKTALENERVKITADLKDVKENLAEAKSEIAEATTARRGLAEMGVGKVAQLVRYMQDLESTGFDVGQVKKLFSWRRELEKLYIDPDGLGRFITERGPLESQNNILRLASERIEASLSAQTTRRAALMTEDSALHAVDQVLKTRTLTVFCKSCGHPLSTALPTQESIRDLINAGQALGLVCPRCGAHQLFSPWEIALQIAWIILPTSTTTT
jgi:RNase P subunit RPR2/uncharacterized protein (UPF0335 family)